MRYLRLNILRGRDINQATDDTDYAQLVVNGVRVTNSTTQQTLEAGPGSLVVLVRGMNHLELAASIMNLITQLTEDFHPCEIAIMPNIQRVVCLPNIVYSQDYQCQPNTDSREQDSPQSHSKAN
jgi:hypothetical protein